MGKTLEEMCHLVTGRGAWHIGGIRVSDGPHGIRAQEDGAQNNDSYEATCFPTASSTACSWDRELIGKMAQGIAKEAKALGVSVVLGPGVNIKRSPLCGRNFEYYSEDPFLTGELAVFYITRMQACGVGTSLKHFAGNSQETHRMTSNSMIDERALHEIYLSAFEMAVKRAKPASVMASYNYLNGISACENSYLLTDILRNQWKYEGLVMSDWGACVDLPTCILAGMDVEMPDSCGNHYMELLDAARKEGSLVKALECATKRIEGLNDCYRKNIISGKKGISIELRKANHDLAGKIEEESAVLLKNDGFLPLQGNTEVLLVGDLADVLRIQGGGSSHINTKQIDSLVQQFEKYNVKIRYTRGYKSTTFQRDKRLEKEAIKEVKTAKDRHIPVLFVGGLTDVAEGEGYDRESFELPFNQTILLERLLEVYSEIGFISVGGAPYNMELPSKCKALLQLYLGGEAMASACVRIILGIVNPSGKLAETIPYSEKDVPSYGFFGKQEMQSMHMDDVEYRESIFVGYRYYDTFDIPVRYCFGYGLSYTQFLYSNLKIIKNAVHQYHIMFDIENIGMIAGSEVSEVYVKNPDTNVFRPRRELRGFAKTYLNPGEKKTVEIVIDNRAFSVYQNGKFQAIRGMYEIQVGASLQDIRLLSTIEVEGEELLFPLNKDTKVPLTGEDFDKIYTYPHVHFSEVRPGQFTTKNSLIQMKPYSRLARKWINIGKLAARLMYFPKSVKEPEVRMMVEGILEGNIDSVCNQSNGLIKKKTITKIVESANKERSL